MSAGFATCGANAYRVDKIVSVRQLIRELVDECRLHLEPSVTQQSASPAAKP
jgi:hypothetical protein